MQPDTIRSSPVHYSMWFTHAVYTFGRLQHPSMFLVTSSDVLLSVTQLVLPASRCVCALACIQSNRFCLVCISTWGLKPFYVTCEDAFARMPGPESQALIKDLGHDPALTTLADMFRRTQCLQTSSGYLTMLSMQSHAVGGSVVTTVLVQYTEPAAHLTAETVRRLSPAPSQWQQMSVPCCPAV